MYNLNNINVCYLKAKRAIALFAFIILSFQSKSQINLINNPDFELFDTIPYNHSQFKFCKDWYTFHGTVDYCSTLSSTNCSGFSSAYVNIPSNSFGFQNAHSGSFYAGIVLFGDLPSTSGYPLFSKYFEAIGDSLKQPLVKNHIYSFGMYYNCANFSGLLSNRLNAYFSSTKIVIPPSTMNPLSQSWYDNNINYINPQIINDTTQYLSSDTTNWIKFSRCFLAMGGEQYVNIGDFKDKKYVNYTSIGTNFTAHCNPVSGSQYYYIYIDDLSLYDIGLYNGNAKCKNDTVICASSNTVILGNNIKDSAQYSWQPTTGLSCTNCPNPIASPSITTKYYVTKTLCSITSRDSITVTIFSPNLALNAGTNSVLCVGDSISIGSSNSPFYNYSWQPTLNIACSNCPIIKVSPTISTTYTLTRTACSEIKTATVNISIKPNYTVTPKIALTNTVSCLWDTLNFKINVPPAIFFQWLPPYLYTQTNAYYAKALINNNSYYYYTLYNLPNDPNYCPYNKRDSIYISIPDTCKLPQLILPQAISANGDGINDEIIVQLPNTKNATIQVFNRWGNEVYKKSAINENENKPLIIKWDGTYKNQNLPSGTYFYIVESINTNNEHKNYKQFVVIMR